MSSDTRNSVTAPSAAGRRVTGSRTAPRRSRRPLPALAAYGGVAVLLLASFAVPPSSARPPEIGLLQPDRNMRDNLRHLAESGKRVELVLKNGKSYRGLLGAVGDHSVVVREIEGREFFDALVVIDEIAAVEVRVRDR